jgi:hypothetical protein
MDDLFTAADAREAALDRLDAARPLWVDVARQAATRIAEARGQVTIDDVREVCPPPEGTDPRVMGTVLRKPVFEPIGYVQSTRIACHGRPIRVFRLAGRAG